jgi:hypothetical protein
MSSEAGASILDATLACIGERISIILLQPQAGATGNKDGNYIASLHNEVVSIPVFLYQRHRLGHRSNLHLDLACCHLDCWPSASVAWWQVPCSRASQGCFPQLFRHYKPRKLYRP